MYGRFSGSIWLQPVNASKPSAATGPMIFVPGDLINSVRMKDLIETNRVNVLIAAYCLNVLIAAYVLNVLIAAYVPNVLIAR
jgi:hypothetical protein